MCDLNEEYYEGFEGEPEIIFSLHKGNGVKSEIGIWSGYFNGIMEEVVPKNGVWTSLAYYYHLYIGWYDESPWLIENVMEAYELLAAINKSKLKYIEEKEILEIILDMLREGMDNNCKVFILYD